MADCYQTPIAPAAPAPNLMKMQMVGGTASGANYRATSRYGGPVAYLPLSAGSVARARLPILLAAALAHIGGFSAKYLKVQF